jgi:spore coat protein CotH
MRHRALAVAAVAVGLCIVRTPANAQAIDDIFDSGTLHEIRLFINSRDLGQLRERYLENTYYTADFSWKDVRVRNAGVRSRGVASRSGTKLSLRVDFNRYAASQRFLGRKSIVLDNLWQDGSMLHEYLSMAFFARMGQAAPRTSFARVFINNEYQGLYAVVESIDEAFLARTIGESAGYLFSYQHQGPFYGEPLGEDLGEYKRRFEPQTHEREADSILYGAIRSLFEEVNEPEDAVWRERVERYVDLPQFITQVAIESFLAEEDGLIGVNGMNNFHLYRYAETDRHRFFPWDKDSAFLLPGFEIQQRFDQNVLVRRALEYPDLRKLFFDVLELSCVMAYEDSWLETEIVRLSELIAPAVESDTRKPFSTEAFYESLEFLRDFARRRPAIVRDQIARIGMTR